MPHNIVIDNQIQGDAAKVVIALAIVGTVVIVLSASHGAKNVYRKFTDKYVK